MKKLILAIVMVLPAIAAFPQTKNILMPPDLIMNYSIPVSSTLNPGIYIPFGSEISPQQFLYSEVKMSGNVSFGKYILDGLLKNKVPIYKLHACTIFMKNVYASGLHIEINAQFVENNSLQ